MKAQVTSAGRVSVANGVEHTATELNTAMTALKRAIADKADTKLVVTMSMLMRINAKHMMKK